MSNKQNPKIEPQKIISLNEGRTLSKLIKAKVVTTPKLK
ncbi:hypothetical protein QE417_003337 [Mucilaginibacter terrae]|uniref:DNA-binding protein n=1 Tax=Mucilaginibacter terrae TaxID=1955052 RepID=A0ABU3GWW5_9SPHI|nr:hypothetical protein [Mucilaginibacter terrae]